MEPGTSFRFRFLDANGNRSGLLSSKGRVERDAVVLDKESIPLDAVLRARSRFDVLILEVPDGKGGVGTIAFAVTSRNLAQVQAAVNLVASARNERLRRQAATSAAPRSDLRFETCPHCRSRVDVSGLVRTGQVWCGWCERLATLGPEPDPDEARYRLCDACGYYASPILFTDFLFWFAIWVWGWSYRKKQVCRGCMRREAWIMLAKNALFVLGVPHALLQLGRAYAGGRLVEGRFAGLDAANVKARKKRTADAVARYAEIEKRAGRAAGVAYCRGLAHEASGELEAAASAFEDALRDCSNFAHAYERLAVALRRLRRADELAKLRRAWSDDAAWEQDRRILESPAAGRPRGR